MLDRLKAALAGEPSHLGMLVGGTWLEGPAAARVEVENPANGAVVATVPAGSADHAHAALEAARKAQPVWAATPAPERGRLVGLLADAVRDHRDLLAHVVVAEQGKPLNQAHGEIGATETFLRYAAESGRRIEGDIMPSDMANEEIWIRRVPYGVVVGLTAWNYPAALTGRKLGPALVAATALSSRRTSSRRFRALRSRRWRSGSASPRAWSTSSPAPVTASARRWSRVRNRTSSP